MSGNVHVALGKSVQRDGKLVHEFNIEDIGCEAALKQFLWVFGCMVQQSVSEKQIKILLTIKSASIIQFVKFVKSDFFRLWKGTWMLDLDILDVSSLPCQRQRPGHWSGFCLGDGFNTSHYIDSITFGDLLMSLKS